MRQMIISATISVTLGHMGFRIDQKANDWAMAKDQIGETLVASQAGNDLTLAKGQIGQALAASEAKASRLEAQLQDLSESYLKTVEMGLLGGLNHGAYVDPTRQGSTDTNVRRVLYLTEGVPKLCKVRSWLYQSRFLQNRILQYDSRFTR